jgi:hypothetical protein
MAINYKNGKIYKIEPVNGEEGEIYVGSTTKQYLSQRMTAHRAAYNRWKNGNCNKVTSYDLFDKYGMDNCQIILLENCPCGSRDELHARESHFIRTLNCVNKVTLGRTKKEYKIDNKEHLSEQAKIYREKNKEYISEQAKMYYHDNKEQLSEYKKEYYETNKKTISEKKYIPYICECGLSCMSTNKARHFKTKKHQDYINSK